jgi:DNA-binding transcriptional regulator YiaG
MANRKCPYCEDGHLAIKTVEEYSTRLSGIPFVVKDAQIAQCDSCGGEVFAARERKRWEADLQAHLREDTLLITSAEIRRLREGLGFGVSDFAKLCAVTRQTVYAWEAEDCRDLQLSPTALLLGLLLKELDAGQNALCRSLVESARQRNQMLDIPEILSGSCIEPKLLEGNTKPKPGRRVVPLGAPNFRLHPKPKPKVA